MRSFFLFLTGVVYLLLIYLLMSVYKQKFLDADFNSILQS